MLEAHCVLGIAYEKRSPCFSFAAFSFPDLQKVPIKSWVDKVFPNPDSNLQPPASYLSVSKNWTTASLYKYTHRFSTVELSGSNRFKTMEIGSSQR